MGFFARRRTAIASGAVAVAAVAAVVAYALVVAGYRSHHAQINDGGVWVTKGKTGQFGRLNHPINQLDGAVYTLGTADAASYKIDVLQDGSAVVGEDLGTGNLFPIDDSSMSAAGAAKVLVPGNPKVGIAGGSLAVLDPVSGAVRAMTFDPQQPLGDIAALGSSVRPLASVGRNAALAVGQDGTVYAASPSAGLVTIQRRGDGFAKPTTSALKVPASGSIQLSAVGSRAVALITSGESSSLVVAGGRTVAVPTGTDATLQQSGPNWSAALVATDSKLLAVPLGNGPVSTLSSAGTGTPAAPLRFGGCTFAAWAGAHGTFGTACSASAHPLQTAAIREASSDLVFRTNWGQIMLNDRDSGDVWNLDTGKPQQVANWSSVTPPRPQNTKTKNKNQDTRNTKPLPPKPVDDKLGARAGRTTPLYVLDNDNDPSGELLAVDSIDASAAVKSMLSISPDGQTVDLKLPAGYSQSVSFKYTVAAPKGGSASANVVVELRQPGQNLAPKLRRGATHRIWSVPESGTVTLPVLGDWRDYDGDPVVLTGATASKGTVSTTPDGQLVYTAPATSGEQRIDYQVGDGMGGTNKDFVKISVESDDAKAVAAVAAPDYVRGQVNRPITVAPLANDLPGSDPSNPTATLQLAADVPSLPTAAVVTDVSTGTVVVTPRQVGSVQLHYQVKYGNAAYAQGLMVIKVDPRSSKPQPPVTAPDVAVLHGQQPVSVDVLANDADPAGNVMVVQQATAAYPGQLQVAVVDGQFLRVRATNPTVTPAVQSIEYTVSDGVSGSATGSVTVTQVPVSKSDQPVALDDYATVRGGHSVAIPVLDNDSTPDGDPVSLVRYAAGMPAAGQYVLEPGGVGKAYVSGRFVRFVAPVVKVATPVTVDYLERTDADETQTGHAHITITPAPNPRTNPNRAPQPPAVTGRAVAGQTIFVKVPTSNVDPDGDPVSVTGIGSATEYGRVLAVTATGIRYQAYPRVGNGGTDSFSYQVMDIYGATATASVRIAVVPPGDPQPPVAVDDSIVAAPDSSVQLDVLANDIVAPDDQITVSLDKRSPAVRSGLAKLAGARGPVVVRAPHDVTHPLALVYTLSDGVTQSSATIAVKVQKKTNLPPVAFDQYAKPKAGAQTVDVNLLAGDYDQDSTTRPAAISPANTSGVARIPLTRMPQVIPYVIRDARGGLASAVVYVPSSGAGAPMVRPDASITLKQNTALTVDIRRYVVDPAGRPVRTTTTDTISASPSPWLSAKAGADATHLILTPAKGYDGPAAVSFEVTDGKTLTDKTGNRAFLTIPVQVGDVKPVLRCPSTPLSVVQGGKSVALPVASYCHVWMPTAADAQRLTFTAVWSRTPSAVSISGSPSSSPRVTASGQAKPGETGAITVNATGRNRTTPSTAYISVIKAPPMTVTPIVVDGVGADTSRTIDIAQYLTSPLRDPRLKIVRGPDRRSGLPATASASGTRITIRPGADSKNTIIFTYDASDAPNQPARSVTGQITLHVLGHPEVPTNVQPSKSVQSNAVSLTWTAPAANGAPITRYVVKYNGGSKACGATPSCLIGGLVNGRAYRFTVTAYNDVGASKPSATSPSATPDAVPTAVLGFTGLNPQDHQLTFRWTPLHGNFSTVQYYEIDYAGGSKRIAGAGVATTTITGLVNHNAGYGFTIRAHNAKGFSATASPASGRTQSSGRPAAPVLNSPDVSNDTDGGGNSDVIKLSWPAVDPNGRKDVQYKVVRTSDAGGNEVLCPWSTATACPDAKVNLDGTTYTYVAYAKNADATSDADLAHVSTASSPKKVEAARPPGAFATPTLTPTGVDGTAVLKFDAPPSHGKSSTVTCHRSDNGSCPTWHPDVTGQHVEATLTGFANGTPTSVTLTENNGSNKTEFAGTNESTSDPASATTYGPIAPVQLNVSTQGTQVSWSFSGDANGRSAHVAVRSTHGYAKDFDTGARGFSDSGSEDVGYSYTDTITVTVADNGRSTQSASDSKRTMDQPPPPVDPPQISDYVVVLYAGQHVGIAWTASYNAGSEGHGGECHWTRDGSEFANPLGCAYNGRASRQFYSQPTGAHTYCGYIQMPDGRRSNQICKSVNVS